MRNTAAVRLGIRVGGWASGVGLAFLYVVAAPTEYYRARVPFLLGSGVTPLVLITAAFEVMALIGLFVAGAWSWASLRGATFSALACSAAVCSGAAAEFVPSFPESAVRWAVFAVLAGVSTVLLLRERRALVRGTGQAQVITTDVQGEERKTL